MTMKPRNVLVTELFDVTYTCAVKAVYMDICHTPPEVAPTTTRDFTNTAAGCYHTVDNSNERHIMEALAGTTRYTGNTEEDTQRSEAVNDYEITINEMVELVAMDASFTFTDPNDVTKVDEVIGEYQALIHEEKIREVDGHFPPDEDMEKLAMFRTVIHPLVAMVRNAGTGTAKWDQVIRTLIATPVEGRRYKMQRMKEAEEAAEKQRIAEAQAAKERRVAAAKKEYKSSADSVPDPYSF